jgi:hypothetical protein
MTLPAKIFQLYHYADPIYKEASERVSRIQTLYAAAELHPSKHTAKHRKIWTTLGNSVWTDHASSWQFRGSPIAVGESYHQPNLRELSMAGVVWHIVPQVYSVYSVDTRMILFTLPEHRDALIDVRRRIEATCM